MPERPLIGPRAAPDLHVMTFNIRRRIEHLDRRSPDVWGRRRDAVRALLERERPTVLGVQEALFAQALWVSESLGPRYRRLGRGRNADGRGEGTPLFIDTERLTVAAWRQIALSDTPDVPGSRSFGNLVPRIAVIAELVDRATSARFRVVNTHFDHLSRRSRERSADLVADVVLADDLPAIVMGDANTSVGTVPHERILARGLRDAWREADVRLSPPWGTFPNYRRPRVGGKRIDWLLVRGDVHVLEAGIDARRPGGVAPSDHLPVQAVVRVGSD